jgi:hypothetical protein
MGDWLVRVHFPDGRMLYANYLSGSSVVGPEIYADYIPQGQLDENGYYSPGREREKVDPASLLPSRPDLAVSDPDELILVRVAVDHSEWPALFCQRRNQLLGPMHIGMADCIQREFQLIEQNGKRHLVHFAKEQTACGQNDTGEEIPYKYFEWGGFRDPDPLPPLRDLFEEWNGGQICRTCLLNVLLSYDGAGWEDGNTQPIAVPSGRARGSGWAKRFRDRQAGPLGEVLKLLGTLAAIMVLVVISAAFIGYMFPG